MSIATLLLGGSGMVSAQPTAGPRLADGTPNLTGTWDNGSGIDFVQPVRDGESICLRGCETGGRAAPVALDRPTYRPEFRARVADLDARQVEEDPVLRCHSPGLPRIGPPDKILQIPGQVVFLYDDVTGNYYRVIPMDGRGHDDTAPPSSLGDSIGHWDGDELVVEAVNFVADTWLTDDGSFHTADLRVVERLRREGDVLHWQATAHDPAVLAEPWAIRPRTGVLTDIELIEAAPCLERDLAHIVDGTHHDNPR